MTQKHMPPSYCAWCEEKLATIVYFPYCSKFCQSMHRGKK